VLHWLMPIAGEWTDIASPRGGECTSISSSPDVTEHSCLTSTRPWLHISHLYAGSRLKLVGCGKVPPYMPAFQPYRGKPAVRNDREGRGNVGIIRSPIRASTLPDCGGRSAMSVPTAS
jgi:hypothetical protein